MKALALLLCLQNPADGVGIDQRLGEPLSLDLVFRDEEGRDVRLRDVLGGRPAVLLLVYYRCPMLCGEIFNGMVRAVNAVPLALDADYRIVTISFNPAETPELAAAKKEKVLGALHRRPPDSGWRFLTGSSESISRICGETGFRYRFDAASGEFAHGSAIMVVTPAGRLARYFFGVEFPARDLKLSLVEASQGRIGTLADRLLLLCFEYDPARSGYSLGILKLLRVFAVATVALVAGGVLTMRLRELRRTHAR